MNRYRVNPKNFPKFKRGFRGGEYYLEKPCLGCQANSFAIHKEGKQTFYPSKELLNKYKKYLPKLTPTEIEVGVTEENRDSVEIIFGNVETVVLKLHKNILTGIIQKVLLVTIINYLN